VVEDILGFSRVWTMSDHEVGEKFLELAERFSSEFEKDIGPVS
jgi:hypothetical protein